MESILKIPVNIIYDLELLLTPYVYFFFLSKNYTEPSTHFLLINLHS